MTMKEMQSVSDQRLFFTLNLPQKQDLAAGITKPVKIRAIGLA